MPQIKVDRSSRGLTVRVAGEPAFGELDAFVSDLRPLAMEGCNVSLVWTQTERIHIAFLQALMSLRRSVEAAGGTFALSVGSDALRATLGAFGLADALGLETERKRGRRAA
ncbi:MAG TPA: STAS domain-containing protein [Chthonomonadales bacterium]|nr:STAS domain-containing protein [Chthonomonadales bacterium]